MLLRRVILLLSFTVLVSCSPEGEQETGNGCETGCNSGNGTGGNETGGGNGGENSGGNKEDEGGETGGGDELSPLKVMSFNILAGQDSDTGDHSWPSRKIACLAMLRQEMPEVAGIQEARRDQITCLAANMPEYAYTAQAVRDAAASMHNMILYRKDRFSLLDSGVFWLSDTPGVMSKGWDGDQNRCAVWVKLGENGSGKELFFFCTHLDHIGEQARLKGARLIVSQIKEIAGTAASVFVVGDMNASYAAADSRRAQLQPFYDWMYAARDSAFETTSKMSYNALGERATQPTWNIDHIFYRNVAARKYRVLDGGGYGVTYISDHWPITLDCRY